MMVMRRPVKVLLRTKEGFKEIPSPFRFMDENKVLQNTWNLKQVIFLEGTLEITMRLEQLLQVIKNSDLVPKICATDLGLVRVLKEDEPQCKKMHDRFLELNNQFNLSLTQLVVPVRFSVLALLTARKCTVFDDSIIQLMHYLRDLTYEDVHIYKMA